jgi:hypothetical protein
MRSPTKVLIVAALAASVVAGSATSAAAHPRLLAEVKEANNRYRDVHRAKDAGFALLADAKGITCIDGPKGEGNMGYHYVNGSLVGDGKLDPLHPEAILYERTDDGLRITAVEYVLFASDWHKKEPPKLFGHDLMLVPDGNRFGLPAFYQIHAWLWKDNPSGRFEMFNPRVDCP